MGFSPVGSANDEDILFVGHAIHFCQDLVDHSISCPPRIPGTTPACLGDGVQLIKEKYAGGSLPCLQTRMWGLAA